MTVVPESPAPRISVLTISYNQAEFLPRCLASVRNQDYSDYEHIVVDPGSTDGSREWLIDNPHPNMRLITGSDNGPAQGLNHGLDAARGQIVAYLNSDDVFAPGALSIIDALHSEHPAADIVLGNGWTIDNVGSPVRYIRSDPFNPRGYALGVATVLQQSSSYKRRLFDDGLRFNEANQSNWDSELFFDAWDLGASFVNVHETVGYFRLQPESITVSGNFEERLAGDRQRLRARGARGGRAVTALAQSVARLKKRVKNEWLNMIERPAFPGHVRDVF